MNPLLIKILAVGLTLSQLMNRPVSAFKTQFDPQSQQKEAENLLHEGCISITKEFGAEKINFDLLFSTMLENLKNEQKSGAMPAGSFATKLTQDLDLTGLYEAYKQFCKGESVPNSTIQLAAVLDYYNRTLAQLPDVSRLKDLKLSQSTLVLDGSGQRFTEVYKGNNRRRWVPIGRIPKLMQDAFVAAEDKRFYHHHGFDVRGIIRAFMNDLSGSGRPQGGSTITQQVVKNLLVGDSLSFERKIREIVLATKVESVMSKDQILELYLNYVFLGRASWGVETAAQSYFGKDVNQLDLAQTAFVAGMTKGPNYYNPLTHPDRATDRTEYVLYQMKKDGYIKPDQFQAAMKEKLTFVKFTPPHAHDGFYFLDAIKSQAKKITKAASLSDHSYIIHSTLDPKLQTIAESALQDGLANYEERFGRAHFSGPEENISQLLQTRHLTWQQLLPQIHGPLYDVHWPLAVILQTGRKTKVGLADGSTVPLVVARAEDRNRLQVDDIVYVQIKKSRRGVYARLRARPKVQGAIIIMENKTGRVLAMSGGFSYPLSQLNRALLTERQPGSTLKPFIYLAALNLGFQPNTLIPDEPIQLPPLDRWGRQWWAPHDYDGKNRGLVTIREALERSINLPTARIMTQLGPTPAAGLDYIRGITQELGIYRRAVRFFPFVLGAQPARLVNMAEAYAALANDGLEPVPHFIDRIDENGRVIYQPKFELRRPPSVDRVSYYQIRKILEGVVSEGTAYRIHDLTGIVGGKTGTSNDERDAWFMGFTNDLVIGVWVGYDDARKQISLGARADGANVALPIFEQALRASFLAYKPKAPLSAPPPEVASQIVTYPIEHDTGAFDAGNFMEVFRRDSNSNGPRNTRLSLLNSDENQMVYQYPDGNSDENNLLDQQDRGPQEPERDPAFPFVPFFWNH